MPYLLGVLIRFGQISISWSRNTALCLGYLVSGIRRRRDEGPVVAGPSIGASCAGGCYLLVEAFSAFLRAAMSCDLFIVERPVMSASLAIVLSWSTVSSL